MKQCKAEAENAKVSVRNARRDAIDGLKKAIKQGMPEDVEKDSEANVQKIHDKYLRKSTISSPQRRKRFSQYNATSGGCPIHCIRNEMI